MYVQSTLDRKDVRLTAGDNVTVCFLRNTQNEGIGDTIIFITSEVDDVLVTFLTTDNGALNQTVMTLPKKYTRHMVQFESAKLLVNTIENKGIMIASEEDIHVLGYNDVNKLSSDMFTPLTASQLGLIYASLTYCEGNGFCVLGIVAQLEPVSITVYLPAQFTSRVNFNGVRYKACDIIHIKLQPLQAVQLGTRSDFTGFVVSADSQVAVYAGAGKTSMLSSATRDHLTATLPPLMHWGLRELFLELRIP
ncbi:IgGFc-binding protein-like [Argopecten irradians]|uniref:IgGFc-binding protein-like n=1 Tax=Argopecten irradians TaxID=31199 RepID=UPI0037104636